MTDQNLLHGEACDKFQFELTLVVAPCTILRSLPNNDVHVVDIGLQGHFALAGLAYRFRALDALWCLVYHTNTEELTLAGSCWRGGYAHRYGMRVLIIDGTSFRIEGMPQGGIYIPVAPRGTLPHTPVYLRCRNPYKPSRLASYTEKGMTLRVVVSVV